MNAWFDRFLQGLGSPTSGLTREEAQQVLELAGAAARTAGARQFAPIATYLAGRLAATTDPAERVELLRRATAAAAAAGAGEPLGLD